MSIPVWSIVTLCTELVVTACVFIVIYRAYKTGRFLTWLAFGVLAYELLFNVTYMATREVHGAETPKLDPYTTALAIFHGVFSLVMFAALVAFFLIAWRRYKTGENFFLVRRKMTLAFVGAWSVSILSGVLLFLQLYL